MHLAAAQCQQITCHKYWEALLAFSKAKLVHISHFLELKIFIPPRFYGLSGGCVPVQPAAVLPSFPPQVDVQFVRMTKRFIPLSEIKAHHLAHKADGGPLKDMMLFSRQRLSIQPLTQGKNLPGLLIPSVRQAASSIYGFSFLTTEEFDFVLSLEEEKPH